MKKMWVVRLWRRSSGVRSSMNIALMLHTVGVASHVRYSRSNGDFFRCYGGDVSESGMPC